MAKIFVAQSGGEVGGSDMWWNPWMVIRIERDASQDAIIRVLEDVDPGNFFDAQDSFDWALLVAEVTAVLTAANYPVVSIEAAEAVHLQA